MLPIGYRGSDGSLNDLNSVKCSRILAFRLRNTFLNEIVHWMLQCSAVSCFVHLHLHGCFFIAVSYLLGHADMQLTYKHQSMLMKP
jgi:hypothetical protein